MDGETSNPSVQYKIHTSRSNTWSMRVGRHVLTLRDHPWIVIEQSPAAGLEYWELVEKGARELLGRAPGAGILLSVRPLLEFSWNLVIPSQWKRYDGQIDELRLWMPVVSELSDFAKRTARDGQTWIALVLECEPQITQKTRIDVEHVLLTESMPWIAVLMIDIETGWGQVILRNSNASESLLQELRARTMGQIRIMETEH